VHQQHQSVSKLTEARHGDAKPRQGKPTSRMNSASTRPAHDPLAALERARRIAFESQDAERWDGMG